MEWKPFIFVLVILDRKSKICCNSPLPYSYSASIRVETRPVCVGAILTTTWILTLCDCVYRVRNIPSKVTVRVGIVSTEARIEEARQVICPANFTSNFKTPDVNLALVRTRYNGIKFGASVQRAALPLVYTEEKLGNVKKLIVRVDYGPPQKARSSLVGWMKDMGYYTMKTDPGWRSWALPSRARIGEMEKCSKSKEWRSTMICAEFLYPKTKDCLTTQGTLLVYNRKLWGLMNYKKSKCGGIDSYVPYIKLTHRANVRFIIDTIQKMSGNKSVFIE